MDVFPTPWSPRNTSLYLARGAMLGAALPSEEAIGRESRGRTRGVSRDVPRTAGEHSIAAQEWSRAEASQHSTHREQSRIAVSRPSEQSMLLLCC